MPVEDGKQNQHRWWGTLTIDPGTVDENDAPLPSGEKCVFIKTSYNSHFVTTGTVVKKVRIIQNKQDAVRAIESKSHSSPIPNLLQDLDFDKDSELKNKRIVEILKIDEVDTPALTLALNEHTEMLFNDDAWLNDPKRGNIGQDKIRIGRGMASLP